MSAKSDVQNSENKQNKNALELTQSIIKEALDKLGYPEDTYELLKDSLRIFKVRIPVRMDDGGVEYFTAYRAQHNDAVGPTKGGVRFHPKVNESDINSLAIWMSLKAGIVDLPYGGAKGGIICDPREMSFRELEGLSRGYVRALNQIIGPHEDILAPDTYTNSQIMAWMMDEYSYLNKDENPGFITGKPNVLGGSLGRETATAKGVTICIEEAVKIKDFEIEGAKVVVQGFGNAGSYLAKYLHEAGAIIVGISDAYGALHDPDGLDIDYLLDRRDSFGTVTTLFKNTLTNNELLEVECDILVPAAVQNQITEENAKKINASIIVEAASSPTTMEATKILNERGILLVPDILASSGGVVVTYFEWVQNNQGYYWSEEKVEKKLNNIMTNAFEKIYHTSQIRKVDMRLASHMVGVRKMAEASRYRGWV